MSRLTWFAIMLTPGLGAAGAHDDSTIQLAVEYGAGYRWAGSGDAAPAGEPLASDLYASPGSAWLFEARGIHRTGHGFVFRLAILEHDLNYGSDDTYGLYGVDAGYVHRAPISRDLVFASFLVGPSVMFGIPDWGSYSNLRNRSHGSLPPDNEEAYRQHVFGAFVAVGLDLGRTSGVGLVGEYRGGVVTEPSHSPVGHHHAASLRLRFALGWSR